MDNELVERVWLTLREKRGENHLGIITVSKDDLSAALAAHDLAVGERIEQAIRGYFAKRTDVDFVDEMRDGSISLEGTVHIDEIVADILASKGE
jgi:hypothetical protein